MAEILALDVVCAGYGEARVVDCVSLTLEEGRALALLGRNGTGKTTLINTIVGLTRQTAGTMSPACRPRRARGPASAGSRRSATSSPRSPSRRT